MLLSTCNLGRFQLCSPPSRPSQLSLCCDSLGSVLAALKELPPFLLLKTVQSPLILIVFDSPVKQRSEKSTKRVIRFDNPLWTLTEDQIDLSFRGVTSSGRTFDQQRQFTISLVHFLYLGAVAANSNSVELFVYSTDAVILFIILVFST